jgi:predicted transcriptional regulator
MLYKKFGKVTNDVMRNPSMSLKDKGLYAYLCTHMNNDTLETGISVYKMASECGCTPATIKRSLQSLQKAGVIIRKQRTVGNTTVTTIVR